MPKRSAAEQAVLRIIKDKDATRTELLEAAKILERYERRRAKRRQKQEEVAKSEEVTDLSEIEALLNDRAPNA